MRYCFENIIEDVKKEKLQLCIVSYGGSCTNTLQQCMAKIGFVTKTSKWGDVFCHLPKYVKMGIPIIYVYDNPIKSFLSQRRRTGTLSTNQKKLSNDNNVKTDEETFLKLMIEQFRDFTRVKRDDVLILKSSELFDNNVTKKVSKFLNKDVSRVLPLKFVTPKTNIEEEHIDDKTKQLFNKYKSDIEHINEFPICS